MSSVHRHVLLVRGLSVLAAVLLAGAAAACGGAAPAATPRPRPSRRAPDPDDHARTQLAARAALAQDQRSPRSTTSTRRPAAERNVVATVATDGSWRVDIGRRRARRHDRRLDRLAMPTASTSARCPRWPTPISAELRRASPDPGKRCPRPVDPRVQRLVPRVAGPCFTDRQVAAVGDAARRSRCAGTTGQLLLGRLASRRRWTRRSTSGIYCYADDGLLTAAKVEFGSSRSPSTPVRAAGQGAICPARSATGPPLPWPARRRRTSPSVPRRCPVRVGPDSSAVAPGPPRSWSCGCPYARSIVVRANHMSRSRGRVRVRDAEVAGGAASRDAEVARARCRSVTPTVALETVGPRSGH